jgi:hypothetical protein
MRRPMPTTLHKADPKISGSSMPVKPDVAGAVGSQELRPEGAEPAAHIDKQVRAPTERERAEAEFRGAMADLGAGDGSRAEDKLRAALAIDPQLDGHGHCSAYTSNATARDAEQLLRNACVRMQAGRVCSRAGWLLARGANGRRSLRSAIVANGSQRRPQAMLANALGRLGQHKQAANAEMATPLRGSRWLASLGSSCVQTTTPRCASPPAGARTGLASTAARQPVDQQLTDSGIGAVAVAAVSPASRTSCPSRSSVAQPPSTPRRRRGEQYAGDSSVAPVVSTSSDCDVGPG